MAITREQAIEILSMRDFCGMLCGYTSGYTEALDMAVEALQEEPTHGRLIDVDELLKKYTTCEDIDCDTCPIWGCGCDGLLQILKEAPIVKDATSGEDK